MMGLRHRLADRLPVHFALGVVLVIAAAGFLRVLQEHWREGTALIGGALLVAGLARIVLPDGRAGLLAVRSQTVDVLSYTDFGVVMVVLAFTIPRIALTVS
jgi:hypothetical protein